MSTFDPDAATAVYMATISAAAHAKATAYTQGSHWLLLWNCLVSLLAATLILKSSLLVRLRTRLGGVRLRPNLTVFCCALLFFALDFLIELPWSVYAQWWRETSYGLTTQSFMGWLGEDILSVAISTVAISVLTIAIYASIRRVPRSWWAYSAGVTAIGIIVMVVLSPIFIEPLFNTYTPAPPGPIRTAVVNLATRSGIPSDKIYVYNGSKQSERYTANVAGLFGSARIAMSDTMFKEGADIAEVRGVVGHEMGHYAHLHTLLMAAGLSLFSALVYYLTNRMFSSVARTLDGSTGMLEIADPAALPVLFVIVTSLTTLGTPVLNVMSRLQESDADAFSLQHAHEPDGLSRALVKTIVYRASSPSWLEEALFYDHPSVERRVRAAMEWKLQHPDLVGK